MKHLFARKSIAQLHSEMLGENRLRRVLGPLQLTSLGIGCIIGAGIFVITGIAAADKAGPALMLSFAVSGVACIFAALCYSEFASMVPVAGSAYTYAYATLGELAAWIIGWDLILEYTVASSAVANSWSKHFQEFLSSFDLRIPLIISKAPFDYILAEGQFVATGAAMDLVAVAVVALLTIILVLGIRESASFNAVMVAIKVGVVLFVIAVGAFYVNADNWTPFAPYGLTGISLFGHTLAGQTAPGGQPLGMLAGAAIIFFAYIGFDSVSTHAEEARNPKRDVPIGIIVSLLICTVLYIAVVAVLTGMVPYDQIDPRAPVAAAFRQVGLPWAHFLISIGALTGLTSVVLVLMLSQPRVMLAMARDGLVSERLFGNVHPRFRTPWISQIVMGLGVAGLSGLVPLAVLAELVNIGTLLAFFVVCASVLILRYTHPHAQRPFRVPFSPVLPVLGMLTTLLLMFSLPVENWYRLIVWLLVGFAIYFVYGRTHSKLRVGLVPPLLPGEEGLVREKAFEPSASVKTGMPLAEDKE